MGLVALRDLCELIEKSGVKRNQDRQTLLQLAGKLEALMLNKEVEHKNEPAEYAWKERLAHNYSDNVNVTNDKPVSPTNAEPTGFTYCYFMETILFEVAKLKELV